MKADRLGVKRTGREGRGRKWADKEERGREEERDEDIQLRCEEERKRIWRRRQ